MQALTSLKSCSFKTTDLQVDQIYIVDVKRQTQITFNLHILLC